MGGMFLCARAANRYTVVLPMKYGENMFKKVMTVALVSAFSTLPLFAKQTRAAQKEWTVMMFNNAKNNLESLQVGAVNTMESIGSSKDVNIVVQLGRLGSGYGTGNWKGSRRYCLVKDTDTANITSPVLWTGAVDMGDYKNVIDFVKWTAENYPAKHYALIIANHGGGWMDAKGKETAKGISYDDETKNFIKTAQLAPMMEGVNSAIGKKIDIYYSAACLMQGVEVAYELKDLVDVIVGSEEVAYTSSVAPDLWPPFFAQLMGNPGLETEAYASTLADSYVSGLKKRGLSGTLSAVKGEAVSQLSNDLAQWSDMVMKINDANAVRYAKKNVHRFYEDNYADLEHFMKLYSAQVSTTASANAEQIQSFKAFTEAALGRIESSVVVRNAVSGSENSEAKGISVEIPITGSYGSIWASLPSRYVSYDTLAFAKASGWKNFCDYLDSVK